MITDSREDRKSWENAPRLKRHPLRIIPGVSVEFRGLVVFCGSDQLYHSGSARVASRTLPMKKRFHTQHQSMETHLTTKHCLQDAKEVDLPQNTQDLTIFVQVNRSFHFSHSWSHHRQSILCVTSCLFWDVIFPTPRRRTCSSRCRVDLSRCPTQSSVASTRWVTGSTTSRRVLVISCNKLVSRRRICNSQRPRRLL